METRNGIDWERIENFVGFGRFDAPVVFVGIEEGLASEEHLSSDLTRRSGFEPTMDLRKAHEGIADTDKWFGPSKIKCQRTWRPMCDLMLRRGGTLSPTLQTRNEYQALRLGRSNGDTLLMELLPYPHKKNTRWLYARFGRYPTREAYERAMVPKRKELIRNALAQAKREIVVCYGKDHWPQFMPLFAGAVWQDRSPFQSTSIGGTRVVLAPHFRRKEFNTDQQLASFGGIALAAK